MRVGLEATSMLARRSGDGDATASLAEALVRCRDDVEVVLLPLTVRHPRRLKHVAPAHPRMTALSPPIPSRLASWVWTRSAWPPAELFCGAVDVFHGPDHVLPPLLKAAGVLTVHDLSFLRMPQACSTRVRAYARTVPAAARRAARVIVPSTFTGKQLSEWLPDVADRVRVVPPAVRDAFTAAGGPLTSPRRAELGLREPYVLYAGSLERRKNLDLLLRAFALVREKRPDAQLVCVGGPGPGWEEIAATHAALLSSDAVRMAGALPDAELAALTRGAAVFVYPSRDEGFGLPALEALAAGVPVVASRTGALEATLAGCARLVDTDAEDDLVAAVTDVLDAPADPASMRAGASWARTFTWDRAALGTLRVYDEAVREGR